MPVSPEELVGLLALLAEEEEMKVTIRETMKGGLIAGSCAAVGGLFGGPFGIAVGGALGGAVGAWATKGKFRSVSEILTDMNKDERTQLQGYFSMLANNITADDFTTLNKLVAGDEEVRRKMIGGLRSYFDEELKMQIID